MKDFRDKIVVITGAGSGIGRALALAFAPEGARIALNDVNKVDLDDTVAMLHDLGVPSVYTSAFDVSDNAKMQQFARDVQAEWGNAHVVINNAGIEGGGVLAAEIGEETYRKVMEVNFFGVLNGCQAFLPQLLANNEGALVNISSVFGLVGMMRYSDYCASKFAVRGYTEALMAEYHDAPISIHCVHPGGIKTNISRDETAKKYLITPPEDLAEYIIASIKKKKARIVFGSGSSKIWLGMRFLPQQLLKGLIWKSMK